MLNWYTLENPDVKWLVDGLLPADGYSAVIGKPKAGKSSIIRNLVASVIKSRPFLDRQVNIPKGTGRVLYIHLDRKDRPARVASELRQLGITERDEVNRLQLMVAEDVPSNMDQRLSWIAEQVRDFKPHLLVIDLMLQFLTVENANDYSKVMPAINGFQDALTAGGFDGAFVAAFHGRKSTSVENPADDVLGSTAIRGSFTNLVILTQNRLGHQYIISTDQTDREAPWGEIDPTEIFRNDDGTLSLGRSLWDIKGEVKRAKRTDDIERLFSFLHKNPQSTADQITGALQLSKGSLLDILREVADSVCFTGSGVKGDPKLYSNKSLEVGPTESRAVDARADEETQLQEQLYRQAEAERELVLQQECEELDSRFIEVMEAA